MYNSFAAETPVILSKVGSGSIEYFNEEVYPVYKPLVNSQTILRSDTGSLDQTYLVNGYINPISMSLVPGVNTSIGAIAINNGLAPVTAGVIITASNFLTVPLNQSNAFTASSGVYIAQPGFNPIRSTITASISYAVNNPGSGPPNDTSVGLVLYQNNTVIATGVKTSATGSTSQLLSISASVLVSPGDTYYFTLESNLVDLDDYTPSFTLLPITGSGGVGSFSTPYFTTGSNSRNVLTASTGITRIRNYIY